jgi:DNA-directed RNA polymerase specialized sigma24 family protein
MSFERAARPTAPRASHTLSEQSQPLQGMPADEPTTLERCRLAIEQHDERAWEQLYQQWRGVLIRWLLLHPCARLALEQEPPEHYVAAALRKFWQATTRPNTPQQPFSTLVGVLSYLRCCLNSAILDAVRQARHRQHDVAAAGGAEDMSSQPHQLRDEELWRCIERALPERRERLLVFLRYVQGERPREIVAAHPQAFPNVMEVYRLERAILARLRRHPALARWGATGT